MGNNSRVTRTSKRFVHSAKEANEFADILEALRPSGSELADITVSTDTGETVITVVDVPASVVEEAIRKFEAAQK